ncbi:MAG: energy transducer TonB [Bacteroidales bacterium]|nr:energy transducer TonB [Bacteroidales bacterium]
MQIGLVVTLAGVLVAFEWKSYDAVDMSGLERQVQMEEEEIVIQTEQNTPPPPPPPPQEVITELEIVADDEVADDIEVSVETDQEEVAEVYIAPVVEAEEEAPEEQIFQVVEENPGYPGGEQARQEYLGNNIKYPAIARESGIAGTIYITFVVERDGSITDVKVVRGIGGGCDEEAIRVVQGMPKWAPGKQRGKAVRVQFMMPIKFTLAG